MKQLLLLFSILLLPAIACSQTTVPGSDIIGKWNLTFSLEEKDNGNRGVFRQDRPGWLEVSRSGRSALIGRYVGYSGSARPISEVKYNSDDEKYYFSIPPQWMNIDDDIYFEFSLVDEQLTGFKLLDGNRVQLNGVRAPDLTRDTPPVWGSPINLLDDNMSRWIIPDNNKFRMIDGLLVNKETGRNLVTKEKFDDFKLSVEYKYPEGSNSGIYLRGRYEVQIEDSYGKAVSDLFSGAVYGFIEPSVNTAKRANEWQTFEITLVGRHVTVVMNDVEVISNRIIPGITGGALNSNESEPGPIMIQGDHGPIEFRKFTVTPAMYP